MNTLTGKKKIALIIDVVAIALLIFLDQFTKHLAVIHLKDQDSKVIIPKVLELTFLKNRGAAFGILQDQKVFFVMIAVMILFVIAYELFQLPMEKNICFCR